MDNDMVEVSGVMLRTVGDGKVQVLVEVGGSWRAVITEAYDGEGTISHIVDPLGIRRSDIVEFSGV